MQDSSMPTKFPIPFAADAGAGYIRVIPTASQIGIIAGAASLHDGFPPVTFLPIDAGGYGPAGQDFNGILNQLSAWAQWQNAGGAILPYDGTFQTTIGGYPNGAIVASVTNPGTYWLSTVNNNTSDPDIGGANWSNLQTPGYLLSVTGYYKLPGGLIVQWGTVPVASVSFSGDLGAVTFIIPFPNYCLNVSITTNVAPPAPNNNGRLISIYGNPTTTSFHAYGNTPYLNTGTYAYTGFSWLAIGF
jgi:hypothetical protein